MNHSLFRLIASMSIVSLLATGPAAIAEPFALASESVPVEPLALRESFSGLEMPAGVCKQRHDGDTECWDAENDGSFLHELERGRPTTSGPAAFGIDMPASYDSGFRRLPNMFQFENTGVSYSLNSQSRSAGYYNNALQSIDLTRMFGSSVCAYVKDGQCVLRDDAKLLRKRIADGATGGFCLGMALDSIRYFEGQPKPIPVPNTISLTYNIAVPQILNSFAWQYVPEIAAAMAPYESGSNVAQTLQLIQTELAGGRPVLIVVRRIGGAHAVVGFKLDGPVDGVYRLWVYDNNDPFADYFATFTPTLNLSSYAGPAFTYSQVRAIPISVFSGSYVYNPLTGINRLEAASAPVVLVAPTDSLVLVDEVPVEMLNVLDGLGVSTRRIGLVAASQVESVTVHVSGTAQIVGQPAVSAYGGGAAIDLSSLSDGDEVRFGPGLRKVLISSAVGSQPVAIIAGDNSIGNGSATITPLATGTYSISLSYGSDAELVMGSNAANLVAASFEVRTLKVLSQTQEVFQQLSLQLSAASSLTITIGASSSLTANFAILSSAGVQTGTLINDLSFKAFLPGLSR